MGTTLPANSEESDHKQKVLSELLQGYESAARLRGLLYEPVRGPQSADELVAKIVRSFDETLSVLRSCDKFREAAFDDLASFDGGKSKNSRESRKRRGSYRRKRKSETWTVVSDKLEDDYVWRKYGQKEIQNARYPRNYFRCTHKHDQHCKAIKQVQMLENNPRLYQTTYIGVHTCNRDAAAISTPKMIADPDDAHAGFADQEERPVQRPETADSISWDDLTVPVDGLFSPSYLCNEFNLGQLGCGFDFDQNELFPGFA